jgi:hypothetical protein
VLEFLKKWLQRRQWQFTGDAALSARVLAWSAALGGEGVEVRQLTGFQLFVEAQVFPFSRPLRPLTLVQLGGTRLQYRSEMEQQLAAEDLAAAPLSHALLHDAPFLGTDLALWYLFITTDGATDVLDMHPIEVARQMTLLEATMLKEIEAREWIGQGWTRKDGHSKHLVAFIDRFNAVRDFS